MKIICFVPLQSFAMLFIHLVSIPSTSSEERSLIRMSVALPDDKKKAFCIKEAIKMAAEDAKNYLRYEEKVYDIEPVFFSIDNTDDKLISGMYENNWNFSFYRPIPQDQRKMFLFGPPYDDQMELIVDTCTYIFTKPLLSYIEPQDFNSIPGFYYLSTTPLIYNSYRAARDLLHHYNWTRAGIIYDNANPRYSKSIDTLRSYLKIKNDFKKTIEIISLEAIWSVPSRYGLKEELGNVERSGARIILALTSVAGARKMFCEAYKRKMLKPKVVWILFEHLPDNWASDLYNNFDNDKTKREIDCSEDELLEASSGYISISKKGVRKDNVVTVGGRTATEFKDDLKRRVLGYQCHENIGYAYDTLWLSINLLKEFMIKNKQDLYTSESHSSATKYLSIYNSVNFEGISGSVFFPEDNIIPNIRARFGHIGFWTHPNESNVYFATFDSKAEKFLLEANADYKLFQDGKVPRDSALVVVEDATFATSIIVVMWVLGSVGILICLICYVFIFVHGIHDSINIESPIINSMILLGSLLCYVSLIVYGIDTEFISKDYVPDKCIAFLILLTIGMTLSYGTLLAKAWRLYKMYVNPDVKIVTTHTQVSIQNISDRFVYLVVTSLLAVDIIIIVFWLEMSPIEYIVKDISETDDLFADIITKKTRPECTCEKETLFKVIMYSYKGVLVFFGVFLGVQIQNTKIKVQTDATQIAMAIYNVLAVSLIGVIGTVVLADTTNFGATYGIVAGCIFVCTTTTILIAFIPKIKQVVSFEKLKRQNRSMASGGDTKSRRKYEPNKTPGKQNNLTSEPARVTTFTVTAPPTESQRSQPTPQAKQTVPDFINEISQSATH